MRAAWLVLLVACGYPSLPKIGGGPDDAGIDAAHTIDAALDAHPDAPRDAAPDGPPGKTLKVNNYLSWCTVSVKGGASTSAATQTVSVTAGEDATLVAMALSGFELDFQMWHHTDGDTGAGEGGTLSGSPPNTSTAHVTITAASIQTCVWVCCPFTNGTGCPAPADDQCP